MVSEEVELNKALEAAGIQVVETDLGEYIVQLRGEPPSHIITPAAFDDVFAIKRRSAPIWCLPDRFLEGYSLLGIQILKIIGV
jgi:hypothetical protein